MIYMITPITFFVETSVWEEGLGLYLPIQKFLLGVVTTGVGVVTTSLRNYKQCMGARVKGILAER